MQSLLILAIYLSSLSFQTLFKSFRNVFIKEVEIYEAHLFLKLWAILNASSGTQSSISSPALKDFSLDSYFGKWQVVGYLSGSRYRTAAPESVANWLKFANSFVDARSLTNRSLSCLKCSAYRSAVPSLLRPSTASSNSFWVSKSFCYKSTICWSLSRVVVYSFLIECLLSVSDIKAASQCISLSLIYFYNYEISFSL